MTVNEPSPIKITATLTSGDKSASLEIEGSTFVVQSVFQQWVGTIVGKEFLADTDADDAANGEVWPASSRDGGRSV